MAHDCTTETTIATGSWGTMCYRPGGSLAITVPFAAFATYDYTGKYALLTIRRKNGRTLFTRSSDNDELTFSDEGTADQTLTVAILPATQSAADSNITYADIALEGHTVEASIEFKASSSAVTDWAVQGDIHYVNTQGDYLDHA